MTVQTAPQEALEPASSDSSWKTQTYLIGTVGGLLVGLLAARLYIRAVGENPAMPSNRPSVGTMDMLRMVVAVLGLVRQVAELGGKSK